MYSDQRAVKDNYVRDFVEESFDRPSKELIRQGGGTVLKKTMRCEYLNLTQNLQLDTITLL